MNISFTQYVNKKIRDQFSNYKDSVIYGQNIVAGSRISGLGSQLEDINGVRAINSTNSENSLMGFGLGLALSGMPTLFLMKQHDFALLGMDQLTNTTNVLRNGRFLAPFIVLMVVVDSGYEGPQASLSSLDEFASLARVPVRYLSTKESIDLAFKKAETPGLHFLALSQKNMKKSIDKTMTLIAEYDEAILYRKANEINEEAKIALIFYGVEISFAEDIVNSIGISEKACDLFVMTELSKENRRGNLVSKVLQYEQIVIIDIGKSEIHFSSELAWLLKENGKIVHKFQRRSSSKWSEVSNDELEFGVDEIINLIKRSP
jgi:pyruvate/2-oxoglutarate/acetoin dehydrogenase E1 component